MASKARILVIEDDPQMVEFIETTLKAHSYKVYSAPTQEEGLGKIEEVSPDLIILDVMLETQFAGFGVAQKLRSRDPHSKFKRYSKVPILMLTAVHAHTEMRFSSKKDGEYLPVDDFVEKPIRAKDLAAKVESLLEMSEAKRE